MSDEINIELEKPFAPKVSVITINWNNAEGLRRTLDSSSQQTCDDFEQIVIDGGSTDGSFQVISSGAHRVHRWLSESDAGIFHAMNKGIELSQGQYLLFLNSGDHFKAADSLASAIGFIGGKDMHYFAMEIHDKPSQGSVAAKLHVCPEKLSFPYFLTQSLPHQATFIRRELFERVGLYDESLRIASDWKHFLLSICRHNCTYQRHDPVLSVFYADGVSTDWERAKAERYSVIHEEFPELYQYADILAHGPEAMSTLALLRQSNVIRLLQRLGLLWRF